MYFSAVLVAKDLEIGLPTKPFANQQTPIIRAMAITRAAIFKIFFFIPYAPF
jgi:hypothetical protein